MRKFFVAAMAGLLVMGGVAGLSLARNADETSIKDVMKEAFKGDNSLNKKVTQGKATDDDKKRLLTLVEVLKDAKPPRGEQTSWDSKTKALVEAAQGLVDGKADATDSLKKAANCKACHDEHKGK